jgi:hypothetical protein
MIRGGYGRFKRALGRRGGILLLLGLMYGVLGVKAWIEPVSDEGRYLLYTYLPEPIRVSLWLIPAAIALGTLALRGRTGTDAPGFVALIIPAGAMAFSHIWSTVGYLLGVTPWAFGWSSATIWLLVLSLILIVSGWGEVRPAEPRGRDPRA